MRDFLVEILTEELPPNSLTSLAKHFAEGIEEKLKKHLLSFKSIEYFASPRRLAVIVYDLEEETKGECILRQGPSLKHSFDSDGNPTKAAIGFAKGLGVAIRDLSHHKTDKGEWLAYELEKKGEPVVGLLADIVNSSLQKLPITKPMRWGAGATTFARPVHGVLMLFGEEVVRGTVLGLKAGNQTRGHRFHAPNYLTITSPKTYEKTLSKSFVLVSQDKRKKEIVEQINAEAKKIKGQVILDEGLLDEVTALVEWPNALCVPFSKKFLDIPKEVLMTSMAEHQKCFALTDGKGSLLPFFITIANIAPKHSESIVKGNEKVMHARLSDAEFFYKKDCETPLEEKTQKLKDVLFHPKLGSVLDKSERIKHIALYLAHKLSANHSHVRAAGDLAKADLVSLMVGEFPSLQGVMGQYYALHDGEETEVCQAIFEQYLPRFSGDELPKTQVGFILSLADRLDTLFAIFAIGEKPTGVKDPYKCRRHALAIVRMLLSENHSLKLSTLLLEVSKYFSLDINTKSVITEVKQFIIERFKAYLLNQAVRYDVFDAVIAVTDDDLFDAHRRIQALSLLAKEETCADLSQVLKRIRKLLEKTDGVGLNLEVDSTLLTEASEQQLFTNIQGMIDETLPHINQLDYEKALKSMAKIKPEVDEFFESVMVMVEDQRVKNNRLALLSQLEQQFMQVADISRLE